MRSLILVIAAVLLNLSVPDEAWAKQRKNTHKKNTKQTEQVVETQSPQLPQLRPIVLDYEIYVGGIHLIGANFLFEEENNHYLVRAKAHTHGFWYRTFAWDVELISQGLIKGERFAPLVHRNDNLWKKKLKTLWLHFDDQGNVTPEFNPPEEPDERREQVTAEQSRGSLDPLSSVVQMLGDLAINNSCKTTVPVFDGKRRFDLSGEDKGEDFTDPEEYGIYKGNARLCDINFTMVAGQWKDREHSQFWQRDKDTNSRPPFQIWLTKISPELPELVVKAETASIWGRIVVHLNGWHYAINDDLKP